MYSDLKLTEDRPVYIQVKDYMKRLMLKGGLQAKQKLPSTRELSTLMKVSRSTVLLAYAELEDEGLIYAIKGKGNYVSASIETPEAAASWELDWTTEVSEYAIQAEQYDLMKHGSGAERGEISFTSIAPDEKLFDLHNVKRAFLDRMSLEGEVLLNYGYAQGYRPLMNYLLRYMENKGVDLRGKDILITNGFTEGFDLVLGALRKKSGKALCENPTHHTAIKNLKLHQFHLTGVNMEPDGLDLKQLEHELEASPYDLAYLVPSYHNPTGIVTSPAKRVEIIRLMNKYEVPIIEDGFNEELRYSGSHVSPLIASMGKGNGLVYLGSFSKVLFPGLRVGWIIADAALIDYLESMKRARSIHTSTLDQSLLYQYLSNGNFEKYLKRARTEYKRKYELVVRCLKQHLPMCRISGAGGLHLFVQFPSEYRTRELLAACKVKGVTFTPGDTFYLEHGQGVNTMRLGFSRVSDENIRKGIRIIGETAAQMR
ncbi:DNA-binding transcriptional regulator, MocR family, contains an aminotransferase domain [Paenibacillus sp. CF095]|uniref:MocR-like pyridoxine biosynthesis transcription factor PdxR n=1 Tax=Paenibacillus TaxID=44249 RepID=UPI000888BB56|nr:MULTISPECIES: PLP-dependent aminotransferase family protein [Paenibacillus]TDL65644.1 PLP-dependent aminotransferase family protein [Paenibacillus amylolyticus]SDD30351.1 DNA-binding transcriptional regulator, MocR family, contains an aminotransferase domain [Paenibacillus sp. CF095]